MEGVFEEKGTAGHRLGVTGDPERVCVGREVSGEDKQNKQSLGFESVRKRMT